MHKNEIHKLVNLLTSMQTHLIQIQSCFIYVVAALRKTTWTYKANLWIWFDCNVLDKNAHLPRTSAVYNYSLSTSDLQTAILHCRWIRLMLFGRNSNNAYASYLTTRTIPHHYRSSNAEYLCLPMSILLLFTFFSLPRVSASAPLEPWEKFLSPILPITYFSWACCTQRNKNAPPPLPLTVRHPQS